MVKSLLRSYMHFQQYTKAFCRNFSKHTPHTVSLFGFFLIFVLCLFTKFILNSVEMMMIGNMNEESLKGLSDPTIEKQANDPKHRSKKKPKSHDPNPRHLRDSNPAPLDIIQSLYRR